MSKAQFDVELAPGFLNHALEGSFESILMIVMVHPGNAERRDEDSIRCSFPDLNTTDTRCPSLRDSLKQPRWLRQ